MFYKLHHKSHVEIFEIEEKDFASYHGTLEVAYDNWKNIPESNKDECLSLFNEHREKFNLGYLNKTLTIQNFEEFTFEPAEKQLVKKVEPVQLPNFKGSFPAPRSFVEQKEAKTSIGNTPRFKKLPIYTPN